MPGETNYNYSDETGEFISATPSFFDPIEGVFKLARNATFDPPPVTSDGTIAQWQNGAWVEVPDHRGVVYWLEDGTRHVIDALGIEPPAGALDAPPPEPREVQLQAALRVVEIAHANWLEMMTGGATVAERDTWKPKEEAARALIAGTETLGQSAMLAAEASARGETSAEFAALVVAKADAFLSLIGIAGRIRAETRTAIQAITAPGLDLADVEDEIATALQDMEDAFAASAQAAQSNQSEEAQNA